jgi:gliding motility-associated-like protein
MAQSGEPDVVCMGTSKNYYVDATPGSTYIWKVNEGIPEASTANSVDINWTTPGIYTLTVQETTKDNCVGPVQSLQVTVVALPTATVSKVYICKTDLPYHWNGTQYFESGIFTKEFTTVAGCDSIATLELIVLLPTESITRDSICQGEGYMFNGRHITTPGNYSFQLMTELGCDSTAHLILAVNMPSVSVEHISISKSDLPYIWNETPYYKPGMHQSPKRFINCMGCDSTAILSLRVDSHVSSTISASICEGESYSFHGENYSESGEYSVTLMDSEGFDSIAKLELTVIRATRSTIKKSICQGESYMYNLKDYNVQGIYTDTLINVAGCDSIVTIELTVNVPTNSYQKDTICSMLLPFRWDDLVFAEAGIQAKNLLNATGCDSTATYELIVKHSTQSITKASVCEGESYLFNGNNYDSTGVYSVFLTNSAGCDSTAILELTVSSHKGPFTNKSICRGESYLFNGNYYDATGTYSDTLTNSLGCDSIATLELTVNQPSASITNDSICHGESYFFNGKSYNSSGTYYASLSNAVGCDSIAILELTVRSHTSSLTKESICQGESYFFNGKSYDSPGTYNVLLSNSAGCDSVATLELNVIRSSSSTTKRVICPLQIPFIWNDIPCFGEGTYTKKLVNSNGCDSIATLELKVESPIVSITEITICQSELPYTWNNTTCNVAGTYFSAYLKTPAGCDSVASLVLTVIAPATAMKTASFCEGESYPFNGLFYSAPGLYEVPLQDVNGCDSIVTLVLKQNTGTYTSQVIQLFAGETYTINGNVYNEPGVYTEVIKVAEKCDDIIVTELSFIDIPNTLTPNGDGKNDIFMSGHHVQVFNRNGIMLYDGSDGWDGKYKNKPVSKDTYFYVLYYRSDSGVKSIEGYIMIIP